LKKIRGIELGKNQLHGAFPLWLKNLPHLCYLDLGQSDISGHIPEIMGNHLISVRQFLWENRDDTVFGKIYKYYHILIGVFSDHTLQRRDLLWINRKLPQDEMNIMAGIIERYIKAENARLSARINPAAAA
jgi:hypothetical protein